MDKKIKLLAMMLLIMLGTSCCKEDDPIPTPELKLSKNELVLEIGTSETVLVSGGDGKSYIVTPSSTETADAVVERNTLKITGKKAGKVVFTITSADRKATLKLEVKEKPVIIPELGSMVGIYDLEGNPLLSYKMTARSKNGLWLCENIADPYHKRLFLPYYREGSSELLIIAEGLSPAIENTGEQGKKHSIIKEKDLDEGKKVQLKSGEFRLIVEKR